MQVLIGNMPRFERSRGRSRDSRDRRGSRRFEDRPRGRDRRDFDRRPKHFSREKRDVEMTKVTCSSCGVECEVPFKPRTSKPIYCDSCFAKKGKGSSSNVSSEDIDKINEKLDKIMKALKIE
jgi:CxxC-x17-CxxC domain-containing protein